MDSPVTVDEEVRTLKRTVRDLVSLSALPAIWTELGPDGIAGSLADVLLSTLALDLVYIRLHGPGDNCTNIFRGNQALFDTDLNALFTPILEREPPDTPGTVVDLVKHAELHIAVNRFVIGDDSGVLIAASRNAGFPSEHDRLLIGVGVNQTAIVVQRRRAEEQSKKHQELLRVTLASIADGVLTTDVNGRVTFLNPIAEHLTGWTLQDALGQPVDRIFHIIKEGTREPAKNPIDIVLREGRTVGLADHTLLISKDGTERSIDDSAAPIQGEDGNVVGCVLVFRDVTDRKHIEKQIQKVRFRLDSTLKAAEIGTWEFDITNNLVFADANLARMFGVTSRDSDGGPLEAFTKAIHDDDKVRVANEIQKALESSDTFESQYRVIGADQQVRWVVARGQIERDSAGRALSMPGVVVDITGQKLAELELRTSEKWRKLALDSGGLGSFNIDTSTNVMATDARFQIIFTGEVGPLSYEEAFACIHPEDRDRIRQAVADAIRPDDTIDYDQDYRVIHPKTSDLHWVSAKGRANYEGDGNTRRLTSFDGTIADITQRKQMENELRQLAANLSEADHRKDEFLATLAHELRNPLAPIRNGLQLIRLAGRNQEIVDQARAMIERQVVQMVRLVDDLMDVSRITQGKLELQKEPVDLRAIIQSAIETSRTLIDDMGHELTVSMPNETVIVNADFTRLAQVFLNLLNNAAKYSNRGGQIWLTVKVKHADVLITVKDAGIGIAADQLPRIFDLFSQIDQSLEKAQGGLGIGLSLVKRLVELHGGSITATSQGIGLGSEFLVRMPNAVSALSRTSKQEGEDVQTSLRILVVDDNRDSADSLALMLRLMGNETFTAYDGEEAVNKAAEIRPDAILLDVGLPRLNGNEACLQIRKQPHGKDILIIAQTGWGQEDDRVRTQNSGFDHHFVKPVDPNKIMKLLIER